MQNEFVERWPGYDEQSWQERFAELDRQYSDLLKRAASPMIGAVNEIERVRALRREAIQRAWDRIDSLPPIEFTDAEANALAAFLTVGAPNEVYPPYTYAIGEAAQTYLKSKGGEEGRLPGGFYWTELWDAMNQAALATGEQA